MDQNNTPTGSSQNVDALLNDILQGKAPADAGSSSVTAADAPAVAPVVSAAAPTDTASSPVMPMSAPVTPEISTLPSAAPAMGHGLAALSSMPAATTPADSAAAPSVTPAPTPVSVGGAGPTMQPTQQMPQYNAASPMMGKKKAPLIAGAVVAVVVLAGVGAGLVLSGEDQDLRNQAYVAPGTNTQQVAQNTQNAAATSDAAPSGFTVMPTQSAYNRILALKNQYPSAQQKSITFGSNTGTLYYTNDQEGLSYYAYLEVPNMTAAQGGSYFAWSIEEIGPVGSAEIEIEDGTGYAVISNFGDISAIKKIVISQEPGDAPAEAPTTEVGSVAF